ncbi:zinc finger, C2H2 type, partial [Ostertagia ostertagi]
MVSRSDQLVPCRACGKTMVRKNLTDHLRNVHLFTNEQVNQLKSDTKRRSRIAISCPICGESFFNQFALARHCHRLHRSDGDSQDYTLFTVVCDSHADFEKWLAEQCERTCTSFVRRSNRALSWRRNVIQLEVS